MARYSTFKYGDGTKYGEEVGVNLRWAFEVDWDGDSVFDGSNEAGRLRRISVRRGREQLMDESASSFNRVRVGYATVELDDHDRRYDPYNTSSPLYPNILPGRMARLRVRNGSSGAIYPVISGRIADIKPISGKDRRVMIEIEDGIRWLMDRDVSVSVHQSIDVDDAIAEVLSAAEWPAAWGSDLVDATDVISYWWTWSSLSAWEIINRLAELGVGVVFVAADGKIKFYPRHHSAPAAITLTDDVILREISMPQPWEAVRNVVDINVYPTTLQNSGVIWTLQDKPYIGAGRSLTLWATYSYNTTPVAAINVITPQATTDYLFNSAQDGSGTNLTGSLSVAIDKFSTVSKITYTNNSAMGGYIIFAQLRGQAITIQDTVTLRSENASSKAIFGPKVFRLDYEWQQNVNSADALLALIKDYLAQPRLFPTVQLEAQPGLQFAIDLFDRVRYQSDYLGIDENFNVAYIEHESLSDNLQSIRTTLVLEPTIAVSDVYWQFPTQLGIESYFAP